MFQTFFELFWTQTTSLLIFSESSNLFGSDFNIVRDEPFSSFPRGFGFSMDRHLQDGSPHYS
jgi:hypothetical protein